MKTNVIMQRQMGDIVVKQRTKDGMFNSTDLLKQWNKKNKKKKEIKDFFSNKSTQEYIQVLIEDSNGGDSPYLATRGNNGGTWMHPFLFIDFCMWINPKFKLEIIKFVYDNLIAFRKEAGLKYRSLTQSASTLNGCDYPQTAKALNYIVFNKHKKGIRDFANEKELFTLNDVQDKLCFAIDMGYIKTYEDLIISMRKMWNEKWSRF